MPVDDQIPRLQYCDLALGVTPVYTLMVIVLLGLVQYGIAAQRATTDESLGVQYPVPRSLNLVNTSTTSLASRNAKWTGDGNSPIGQHVGAESKQAKRTNR